jgi:hypothetical protein
MRPMGALLVQPLVFSEEYYAATVETRTVRP